MSDNLRPYRAILPPGYKINPGQPTGAVVRQLTTLAAMISGIVGSKSTQRPYIVYGIHSLSEVVKFLRGENYLGTCSGV
jgi:hypothetical protein